MAAVVVDRLLIIRFFLRFIILVFIIVINNVIYVGLNHDQVEGLVSSVYIIMRIEAWG